MDTNDRKRNRKPRATQQPKRKKRERDVVYTEAKPFNRKRFWLQLLTMAAVVLALLLGTSIFFKAKYVRVSGTETYTAYQVRQAAGIQDEDNLLTLNKAKISGRITKKLPYVKTVRVQIQLPDTVLIEVQEITVTYAVQAGDSSWWLIDKDGKVVDSVDLAQAKSYTQILGVQLDTPKAGNQAVALEPEPEQTPEGETIPVTIYAKERLDTVLTVLQNLEKRGLVGNDVVSVDVSNMGNIELWYKTQYQVLLGDSLDLEVKIHELAKTIDQSSEHQSGVLDISYTARPGEVIYTPF